MKANIKTISAQNIFTGTQWLYNKTININDGIITEIKDSQEQPNYHTLIPSFIDVQVYGANKNLFSANPTVQSLIELYNYCLEHGTTHFLPTVATNTCETFFACIDAVKTYWQQGSKGCLGLHIEGPWINKQKRGAHVEELIFSPTINQIKELLDYGKGVVKMITVAPEILNSEALEYLLKQDIVIAVGHSNATYQQAVNAFDKGIACVTHLYNAMTGLQHREPGLVGAAFNSKTVMASIIADGYHVDFEAIKIAKKIMGNRLYAITDAVTECNSNYYQHQLAGDKYECNGVLSGSALTMYQALKNLTAHCNIEFEEAVRMCSTYPAQVLHLQNSLGKIEVGQSANMIALTGQQEIEHIFTN